MVLGGEGRGSYFVDKLYYVVEEQEGNAFILRSKKDRVGEGASEFEYYSGGGVVYVVNEHSRVSS